MKPAKSG